MIDRIIELLERTGLDTSSPPSLDRRRVVVEATSKAVVYFLLEPEAVVASLVAKLSHHPRFDEPIRAEARRMEELRSRCGDRRIGIPRVRLVGELEGRALVVTDGIPGRNMASEIRAAVFGGGKRMNRHFRAASNWLRSFRSVLAVGPDTVPAHGDFGPRNILVGGHSVSGVVDWEYFETSGDRALDAGNFVLNYLKLSRPKRSGSFPWRGIEKVLAGKGEATRIATRFLREHGTAGGKDGAKEVLRRFGELAFEEGNRLPVFSAIRSEPDRWKELLDRM